MSVNLSKEMVLNLARQSRAWAYELEWAAQKKTQPTAMGLDNGDVVDCCPVCHGSVKHTDRCGLKDLLKNKWPIRDWQTILDENSDDLLLILKDVAYFEPYVDSTTWQKYEKLIEEIKCLPNPSK